MKKFDHVVVGMGMSALGVIEALSLDATESILVVDIGSSEDEVYNTSNNSKFKFGKVGDGGSSDLWHGVISRLSAINSIEYDNIFDMLLKTYYPGLSICCFDKHSFIPLKPLRPKKVIKNKFKGKIEILYNCLNYFEYHETHVILFFNDLKIITSKLWLCSGPQGTLKILNKSKLLSDKEYFIDEHLVGYIGQIGRRNINGFDNINYAKNGHMKPFVTIRQDGIRSMYLNVRPAHLGFRNLAYASKYRNFFGKSTGDILINLFSKFNPALILEALYNKFGIVIRSSIYNIVGHIEIERAIKFDVKTCEFTLREENVELSKPELDLLKSRFGDSFYSHNPILLSPGLHLLNLSKPIGIHYLDDDLLSSFKDNTSVFLCSGLSLKVKSPEHPTFSLLVYSYLKAKKYIDNKSFNGNE
jgi:hypothetical protein